MNFPSAGREGSLYHRRDHALEHVAPALEEHLALAHQPLRLLGRAVRALLRQQERNRLDPVTAL